MKIEEIAHLLPEQPRKGMLKYIEENFLNSELGGNFLLFKRESVRIEPTLTAIMTAKDYEDFEKGVAYRWGARCECTACRHEFIAGYSNKNNRPGVKMICNEDGTTYEGYVPADYDYYDCDFTSEGMHTTCPDCGEEIQALRTSKATDRYYQLMVTSVEKIGKYAATVSWLVRRDFKNGRFKPLTVIPRSATVIDEKGKRRLFRHVQTALCCDQYIPEWKYKSKYTDPTFSKYHCCGSWNNIKFGSVVWRDVPDLEGTTGEKTGIAEYITNGGDFPNTYIKYWRQYPQIENLVKSPYYSILISGIDFPVSQYSNSYGAENKNMILDFIDLDEVKPHRMLHLSKEEYRAHIGTDWDWNIAQNWLWRDWNIGDVTAEEYSFLIDNLGGENVAQLDGRTMDGESHFELKKVENYLEKQMLKYGLPPAEGVQYLIDYRDELLLEADERDVTNEELWPPNLIEAHDRIMEQRRIKEDVELQENFNRIAKKYSSLAWSDGELCIRVARSNSELVDEGKILRHCVGRYGESHIKENDVIFFVRKKRRPERSYYTLDIKFSDTKREPYEVQLHGYGNERHGANKEYTHSIPQKVRDFVDRWKKEIMLPWYAGQVRSKKNGRKQNSPAA